MQGEAKRLKIECGMRSGNDKRGLRHSMVKPQKRKRVDEKVRGMGEDHKKNHMPKVDALSECEFEAVFVVHQIRNFGTWETQSRSQESQERREG